MSAAQTIVELKHGKAQLTSAFLSALPEAILPAILNDIVSLLGAKPTHPLVVEAGRKTSKMLVSYILDLLEANCINRTRADEAKIRRGAERIIERHLIEYYE